MRTAKICVVGEFAVGKTSTINRYVHNEFSEKYLSTLGVKIDTLTLQDPRGEPIKLVLWDVAGSDRFSDLEFSYLRGAAGYIVVVDGTRRPTLAGGLGLLEEIRGAFGDQPAIVLLNKCDLSASWELAEAEHELLRRAGAPYRNTSAKTGEGVPEAFADLVACL